MNTTTPYEVSLSGGGSVVPERLRRAADIAEMVGHRVDYVCVSGFACEGRLAEVALIGGNIHVGIVRTNGNFYRSMICARCKIRVVLDLGTVEA